MTHLIKDVMALCSITAFSAATLVWLDILSTLS
jgi:hypothetical protein